MDPDTLVPPETDEISVIEEEDTDLPGIPTDVSAELQGKAIVVSWKAPDTDDVAAEGFVIEYCDNDDDVWTHATSEPLPTADPYPITGLKPGTEYT